MMQQLIAKAAKAMIRLGIFIMLVGIAWCGHTRTTRVGLGIEVLSIGQAARIAKSGDVIEITPGVYRGDTAIRTQDRILTHPPRPGAEIISEGKAAESKALWVIRGGQVTIKNIT